MKAGILSLFLFLNCIAVYAQGDLFYSGALKSKREAAHRNIVRNIINKNLALPVSDSTSEDWVSALNAVQVLNYKSPWVNARIADAISSGKGDRYFKKSLYETLYALYPGYSRHVFEKLSQENDPLLYAMMAEYIIKSDSSLSQNVLQHVSARYKADPDDHIKYLLDRHSPIYNVNLASIFSPDFLPGEVIVYSILRKDRSLPGIVVVRDTAGKFVKDSAGMLFSVAQLGRSVNNLPYYFKGGNTPQGLFRMNGFGISRSDFIGPTPNLQMLMPFESTGGEFMKDSTAPDTLSYMAYGSLLPASLQNSPQFYESWNAGKLGRSEIIAHGTTVNPDYYKNEPFYPLTPTLGCLSTIELWDPSDGRRQRSDQSKLIDAVTRAGGPTGYVFVFEIDDKKTPVLSGEILHLIPR